MRKIISIILLILLIVPNSYSNTLENQINFEKEVLNFGLNNVCQDIKQTDIPTIFIPWILASWYSEELYDNISSKRWIPDPITHVYDTLFKTFQNENYILQDVYYNRLENPYIKSAPNSSFYLFWYDWKKDNKITAKLLSDLIVKIRKKYEEENWCDIGTVNIIAHSMWWLVARGMLEDMCASDDELNNYNNKTWRWKFQKITSNKCNNYTRINKFITISTPHRWSPAWLPMWTRWNIGQTEDPATSIILKWQLWVKTDGWLYDAIHWYNDKIKNGIITIWQLLPDIWNTWVYNESLLYLEKKWKKLSKNNHPQNSFLEELNRPENIEKMFLNISWKFSLYYSEVTWNKDKKNIIWFNISDEYWTWLFGFDLPDKTEKYKWKDIYDYFPNIINNSVYNIENNIRNDKGLWWDWTVPSNNLRLVDNKSYNPVEVVNDKFDLISIKCFKDNLGNETTISKKLWTVDMELCSHTKMPILSSVKVFNNISWKNIFYWLQDDEKEIKERDLLYKNIWYTKRIIENWYNWWELHLRADYLFKNNFVNYFESDEESTQITKISKFIKERDSIDYQRKSLDFTLWLREVFRYEVLSPINLIIEDEQWRKIWIDPDTGMIINEIPWAWTSGNTEWSNEPEFFLIPKTGTWKVNHKITSYPTGNWEYHIVMNEISENEKTNTWFIIAGEAKLWIIEDYEVEIKTNGSSFKKLSSNEISLNEKYWDILGKLYAILDKYSDKEKVVLKNRLERFIELWYWKLKDNKKLIYLIWKIVEYLN